MRSASPPVGLDEYLIAMALAIVVIPVVEIVKFIQRKLPKNKAPAAA